MKVKRIERKEMFDVTVWDRQIRITIKAEFMKLDPNGDGVIKLSKKETTLLIDTLRSQRKRKGVK